jgi:hypothetical protein
MVVREVGERERDCNAEKNEESAAQEGASTRVEDEWDQRDGHPAAREPGDSG